MYCHALGFVIRTFRFSDTSLILHWLTREFGRIATIAKGALRPKSPFRGKLDLLIQAELTFKKSPRGQLHPLREVSVRSTYPNIRRSVERLTQAAYGIQLIQSATENETPIAEVFDLFEDLLATLDRSGLRPLTVLAFEIKMLDRLGLGPQWARLVSSPATREWVRRIEETPLVECPRIQEDPRVLAPLDRLLRGLILQHFDRVPKTRDQALKADSTGWDPGQER